MEVADVMNSELHPLTLKISVLVNTEDLRSQQK